MSLQRRDKRKRTFTRQNRSDALRFRGKPQAPSRSQTHGYQPTTTLALCRLSTCRCGPIRCVAAVSRRTPCNWINHRRALGRARGVVWFAPAMCAERHSQSRCDRKAGMALEPRNGTATRGQDTCGPPTVLSPPRRPRRCIYRYGRSTP